MATASLANFKISSEILLVTSSKIIMTGFAFLTTILLTRCLGAQAFGIYSTCIAIVVLFSGIAGESLDLGLLKFFPIFLGRDRNKALLLLKVVFKMKLVIGVLLLFLFLPFATYIGKAILHEGKSGPLIRLVFLGILGTMLFRSTATYLQAHQDFIKYLILDFVHVVGKLSLIVSLIFLNLLTIRNSIAVYVLVPFLAFFLSLLIVPRDFLFIKGPQRQILWEVLNFCKWLMISSTIAAVHNRLDILMLSIFKTSEVTGVYSAALNLALIPDLLSSFFTIVFYPKVMPMCYQKDFTNFFYKYLKGMTPFCIIGILLSIVFANPLIFFIYTPNFIDSVLIFQILIPGTFFWILVWPLALPFLVLNKPHLIISIDLGTLAIILLGNLVLIPKYGAFGAAVVILCARLAIGGFILIWVLINSKRIEMELQTYPRH